MNAPFDLLRKSELRVAGVTLQDVDLSALARAVAGVLELQPAEVLVTDYLDEVLTFDILRPQLYSHQLVGRGDELLAALESMPGVTLTDSAAVSANGMLGWIAADAPAVKTAIADAQLMANGINDRIAKRVAVFSTGAEMVRGEVKDTNWEAISATLTRADFRCEHLATLPDDSTLIAGRIRRAVDTGFGVVITTGGVGAEAKDCTVEAVETLIPGAATAYTCRFESGHGRHVKDGVRIAVGTYRGARVVCLPGPNDEVRACLDAVVEGLQTRRSDSALAAHIAEILRQMLHDRMGHQHGGPST